MSEVFRAYFLDGKDFLDQHEAAHFMCVSLSKFRLILSDTKIKPFNSHGKIVYRKQELIAELELQAKTNTALSRVEEAQALLDKAKVEAYQNATRQVKASVKKRKKKAGMKARKKHK